MKNKVNKKTIRQTAEKDVPDLKDSIKQTTTYQTFMSQAQQTKSFHIPIKRMAYASSFALLVLLLFIMIPFATPGESPSSTSSLYFEINPSIEVIISEEDEILEINGQNTDGDFVASENQNVLSMDFDEGFDRLIDFMVEEQLIDEEESIILYDVLNENEEIYTKHLTLIEDKLRHIQENRMPHIEIAHGIGGRPTETEYEIANDYNLSIMQVRLIGNILEDDESYDFETLAEKSIRELLEIEDSVPPRDHHDRGPNRHPFDNDDDNGAPPMTPPGRGH